MNNLLPTQRPPMSEDLAWALSVNPATATDDMLGTAAATIMKEHFGQTSLDGRIISGERQRALGGREYYAKVRKAYDTGSVAAWMEQYDIDFNDAETRGDKAAMRKIAREHIQGEGVGSDARAAVDKYDNFGGDSFKSDAERNKRMKEEFDSIRDAISDEDWGEIEKYFGTESEFGWGTERDDFFRREEEHFRARKSLEDQIATKEAAGLDASREYAQIEQMDAEYAELAARQSKLQELTDASRDKVEGLRRKYYDTIRDERRVATFRSQMTERNQWAYLASLKGHISEGAERVLDMALASGENVASPAVLAEFEKLSTPEQRSISGALQMLHYGRDKNFVEFMRDLGTSFADTLGMVTVGAVRGAADSVRRMAMDSNEYRDMVERRAMLEDINRDRMADWGYLGQSVIGVASTIPYMAAAAIPYVGMADMILSAKDQFQTEAARNGVDVASWDYQVGSAAFSIAYAFVEKIQWEKAFGGVSSIPRRQMYCDAFHALRPTLAMGGSIAGTMLTESGEEGIQKALENVVETWGLGKDVAGEAIGGFVEDFVGSLGTMAIIGGFGAAKQKIAYRHGAVGFSPEEQMAAVSRMEDMANHYEGGTATAKEIGSFEREFGRVAEDWIASGRSAPSLRRWGFTSEQADAIGASLSRLWSAVQTQSKTDEERQRREKELFGGRVLTPAEAAARIQNKSYRGKVETDQKTGAQSTELDVGGVQIRVVVDPARVSSAVDPENASQHESIVNALNARSGGNMTVEAFRSLTPEERRGLVEDNKLQAQGDVHFYAPDGTEINGRALAAIVGNVSMTDMALPQTVWHETMHGVLRVVNQLASSGNEEAKALIASLVDAGYAPLSERETVNEEALSDAFQRVMSRRVDVVEHDGVLDRLGRFVARLFGYGTGRADPLKGAHSAQARLFNAAITGNLPAAIRQEESGAAEDDDPVFSMTDPILRRIESAAPKVEAPPPDEAGETAEKPESVGETVAKFRAREPLTKEQMASLAAADEEFTTRLAWDNGYRWNETDGEWQFDEKLERRTDERDLPQTAYMGVDGQMHEPASERHQIVGESGWAWTGSDMAGEAKRLEQSGADRETIWKRTGWWRGGDGKWRIEIPDIPQSEFGNILAFLRMGLRSSKTEDAAGKYFGTTLSKLGTVSNHLDRILMAYPGLNDVYVFLRDGKTTKEGHKGATYFSRTKKTEAGEPKPVYIEFGVKRRPEAIRSTFVHELQHAIQAMEGFDNGGNRDGDTLSPNERNDGKGYEDIPGEIEARLVQTRMEMSPEERSETPPWETERLMLERAKETGDSWSLMKEYREKRMSNEARHQIIGPAGASRLGLRSANDAEEMERSGASRLDIWHETGWWKGVDGKWRIEIPDIELDDSTVDELIDALDYGENPYVQQLTDLVRSPRLFRAYKDLAYLGVEFAALPDGEYGNYVPGGDRITVNISLLKNRDELRGTLAHEIQHAVQAAEGFSKGGNEQEFTPLDSESFRRAAKTSRANAAFLRRQAENWKDFQEDSYKRAVEKNLKEAEEYDRKAAAAEARADEIDENALNGSVEVDGDVYENQFDAYQHIAGEAEARLVMKRLGMTPEERAAHPPWEDLDVEENRQIVRYSIVTDQSVIDEFDDPDKFVYLYRAVKVGPDGAIRPPQSSQEMGPDGKYRDREPEGYLQPDGRITKNADGTGGTPTLMAEERPDLATTKPTADGSDVIRFTERDVKAGKATPDMVGQPKYYFDLKKGRAFNPATGREEDMGALEAVLYDPYGHFSDTPLNDQFATAWKRPDWRVIRVKVLKSDIESGYRAEKAALTVGPHPWNGGTVDSQLPDGLKRNVTLARYWQDDSLVPESEAADILEQKWGGLKKSLQIEDTRISPAMADEMRKRGFSIVETGRVKYAPRHSVSPEYAQDGTVVDSLPAHLREDGRAIVADRANTPAWMADPDGTPTDLSERDWLRREAEMRHGEPARYQISLGAPYQGSKGRIAAQLVDELPAGERFVDLFSGGGAMTHAAMLSGKYDSFRMNDADGVGQELFLQGLRGEWDGYSRESMTPEEFAEIRGTPEALPWSFNGRGVDFAYGEEGRVRAIQNIARIQRLGALRDNADRVEASRTDYRDVELRPGDVVYADPPYAGTRWRGGSEAAKEFDAKAFSDWALAQDVPIYVSEYAMPEGWTEIASVPARAMRGGRTTERLFVQSKFADAHRNAGGSRYSVTPHGVQKQAGVAYPDASSEIVRFSIGSKRREEYKGLLERKRPDLEADEVLAELDKFNDPKKEKIALHWVVRGTIRLPEDSYKVEDALEVAAKAKVDPFSFDSPDAMMEANKDARPNAKRIDPDSVKEFSDRRDEGAGVVSYLVDNSSDGQAAVRRIIDTHWGEDANPWCLAANKQTENFAYDPWFYWKEYSGTPKRIAFRNGRLLAFSASKSSDRIEWWDRMDSGFNGAIPTGSKPVPGDKWGRWRFTGIVDGKEQFIAPGWYERRLSNGGYIQWDDNGYVRDKRTPDGERVSFSDGVPTSYEFDGWEIGWDWMRDRTATSILFSKPGSGKPYFEWNYRDPEHFVWGGRTYEIAKTKSAKALAAYREAMELEQTVFRRELQPAHSEARDWMDARAGNDRRYSIAPSAEDLDWARDDSRYSVTPATPDELEALASHFGTTRIFSEAGYILPDGRVLDFSGRADGYTVRDFRRHVDHREITEYVDSGEDGSGSGSMNRVLAAGGIRLMPETGGIDLAVKPTAEQESRLRDYIDRFNGEVSVDISRDDGENVTSAFYRDGTRASRVLNEIKAHFDTGAELRGTGEQADGSFRYQISGAVGAESLGIRNLPDAEAMERSGASRIDIWRETGWWRGRDGQWRVEIPDFELKIEAVKILRGQGTATLDDLLEPGSALLKAYPSLAKLRIDAADPAPDFGARNLGVKIEINRNYINYTKKFDQLLAHEIQHTIQRIEGFETGGSLREFEQKKMERGPVNDFVKGVARALNLTTKALLEKSGGESALHFRVRWARADSASDDVEKAEANKRELEWLESIAKNAGFSSLDEAVEAADKDYEKRSPWTQYLSLAGEAESRLVEKRLGMTPEERAARPPWEDFDVAESEQIVRGQIARTESVKAPSAAQGITRFSVQSGITAAGFSYERVEDGPFRVILPGGAVVSRKRKVTADDILGQDSMLTHVMDLGIRHGTLSRKARKRLAETFATCFNLVAEWGATEDGLSVVDAAWKLTGDVAFKAAKSNSDKQYLTSVDMLTICKKVDMLVQVMSDYMVKLGRGVMPTDVMELYKATGEAGFQTPCPVCYVFSRWIRGGYDRQTIADAQRMFADEVRRHDPKTAKGKEYWRRRYAEFFVPSKKEDYSKDPKVRAAQEAKAAAISAAKERLNLGYQAFDAAMKSAQEARENGDEDAAARFEDAARKVNEDIEAAFDTIRTADLAGFIKYCIFDVDSGKVWDDFAVAPDEVVFDLRAAGEIARHFPGIKRFIKSKGSAGGKAIETEAENDVGDIVTGIAVDGKIEPYELWSEEYERDLLERAQERGPDNKKTSAANTAAAKYNARNWLKVAYSLPAGSKERTAALLKFDEQFAAALAKSARQRLRGGQRFFSWSDNRTEFGFDMMMNLAQIQLLGDSIQSYSKQLEGAELLAAHGAYNNGSLMASGSGLEDAKPGEPGATQIGGRWVKLKFSDVQGIAHDPLFKLNKQFDKSGNILVGMNDDHIRTALRDERIFFVIPWHASGLGRDLLDYMLGILGEDAGESETDYSPVQEDKWLSSKQVAADLVVPIWDRAAKSGKKFKSCFPVKHAAGSITESQTRYRELRERILRAQKGQTLTQADIDTAMKDEFLSQLVRSLAAAAKRVVGDREKVDKTYCTDVYVVDGKKVRLLKMTGDDVGAIYPYEYWDKKTTYGTSAVNSARYLEYCRRLGVLPKFCGVVVGQGGSRRLTDKNKNPYGDFTAEPMYWQLLVDRRMYANGRNADGSWKDFSSGKYQDTDQVEAVTDDRPFNVDLINPDKVEKKWGKLITKRANPAAVGKIADDVIAKQREQGFSLADGSRHSVAPSDPSLEDAAGQADAAEREIEETTRHAMSWGGPAFSYRSYAEALAARDDAMGIKRPDEDYARILTALGIDGEVDVADLRKAAAELRADIKGASDTIVDLAAKAEQKRFARTVSSLVSGAAEMGIEVGGNARRAWERYLSEMRRMAKGRDYADFYSDMRLDLARLLLAITPEDFDEKKAGEEDGKAESAADAEAREIEDILAAMDEDGADMDALRKRIAELAEKRMDEIDSMRERIRARLDEWRAAEAERRRRAEENAAKNPPKENDETDEDFDEEGNDTEGGEKRLEEYENESVESLEDFRAFVESLKADGMDLSNAGEFAALIRIYVEDWLARQQGDDADPRTILSDPVNAARYRRTVVDILRDLCNKLLDPALGKASVTAERMLAEIPCDATAAEIQSRSRSIIAFVQRNAIRQSAKKMIADLRKNIKLLAIQGKRFDETEKDLGRKITGEREAYARYIYRILDWSDGRIAQEMQKLEDIISGRRAAYEAARGTDAALDDLATTDREIHRATERLNALQLWGGLRRKLPGEIALAAQNITQWLETERDQHERRWEAWKEKLDQEADELARAFTASQAEFTPDDPGWVGQMADALTTNFRMRLERLAAGSGAAGRRAIDMVMARIYEGSERLANVKAAQRARFDAVLAKCVEGTQMSVADFLKALDEKIPEELNRQLVTDAQRIRMTWGQALQLLGELEQTASYARNIESNGREGQRDLIVDALRDKPQMMRLVEELRAVYDENREALSAEFFAVTGNPILQPDPLYLPARMYTGARDNLETSVRAWNPFGPAFSPRVSNSLDFDLTASILDVFADRQRQTACALAFGVRGMELRSILARKEVQDAITRSHGKFPLRQMIAHLTDIVGDGYKDDTSGMKGYRKLVRTIGNVTTYSALSWNVVTMLKQMMSVPSWTAILDGGYTEIFHHICNFDAAAAKELCAEPGFVARYGATGFAKLFAQEVGNPQDGNLLSRLFKAGMTAVQIGDFVPGILVGTGVYKARKLALMDQGMNEAAARKQAARETWGLIEENQQSSRLENTPEILRRGGFLGRQLSKFATSPFMQVAHEIHTLRMWQAEKRNAQRTGVPSEAEAVWRRKFYNQIVCNHVLMPAAFYAVANLFAMGLGGEPPEKDQVYGDLVMQMIAGPWSRIFILGMVADQTGEWAARAMGFKPNVYERGDLAATQYLSKAMKQIGRAGGDIADEDWESLRDDIVKMIGQVNTPFRYATKALQNATGYDPAKERQRRKREIKKRSE